MAKSKAIVTPGPWLQGPVPDLLLGGGLLYAAFFAAMCFVPAETVTSQSLWLGAIVILFTGIPHYGATLLRVIEHPRAREQYRNWTIWTGVAVWGLFALGIYVHSVGSALLTTYLSWSPWHYALQNYGIALMFIRRNNMALSERAQRMLYASFILSFALTIISIHGLQSDAQYTPVSNSGTAFSFIPLGIPPDVSGAFFALAMAAYVICIGAFFRDMLAGGATRGLLPVVAVIVSQALWFTVPVLFRFLELGQNVTSVAVSTSAYMIIWAGVAHSLQYLWVTDYFAQRSAPRHSHTAYFVRCVLTGSIISSVPMLLFSPRLAGNLPLDAGLIVLVASAMNVQHFILDGVVWKLRDKKISGILIESRTDEDFRPFPAWGRRAFWAVGALSFVLYAGNVLARELGVMRPLLSGDVARYEKTQTLLSWIGFNGYSGPHNASLVYAARGDYESAIAQLEESLALWEQTEGWSRLCNYYQRAGRQKDSRRACERAFELSPGGDAALQLALVLASYPEDRPRDAARAIALAEEAVSQSQQADPLALNVLGISYAAAGRFDDAIRVSQHALYAAQSQGENRLMEHIQTLLAGYRRGEAYRP